MAPYRPKSLDELKQAYDKAKAEQQASRPAPAAPQPPKPAAPQPTAPARSIADTVRARENKEALSGAVDDFIKQFSAQEPAPQQSVYAKAQQTAETRETQARQELEQEAQRAFDDVLSFPEIKTGPLEPPVYHRYTHEEAPIKEGDLSGLMDEYIAVMTDQNGEEDNRRSFLRRRKERKKSRHQQSAESEVSNDLFDLPESAPVSDPVEPPPVVPYMPPVEIPVEEPVAPAEIPVEEPVAPVEIPVEEPVAPVELPFEEPVAPVEIPVEEPVAPIEIPFEEPVAPVEIPVEEPAAPAAPPEPIVPKMPEYTPYQSPVPQPDYGTAPPVSAEKKPKRVINMEPEPIFDPHRLFADLDDEPETPEPPAAPVEAPEAPAEAQPEAPAAPEPPAPAPAPEAPQQFEDIISYSDESQNDHFTPAYEAPPAEPEPPAAPEAAADDEEYDLGALDLQQEVVIRPSKVKVFFKILVGLLILLSLIATAAVGAIRLVMNVNTGKSAFGDYYFFAVSNEYANVDIHSGDLILAKRKVPLELGERAVYVDPDTRSFSFGKNDASSPDPELYNALVYNLSGIAVREENVLGAVVKTVPQGGTIVRKVLADFYTYLGACLGAFFVLLLIRVIFLRKKRRYLTVEELAQSGEAKQKKQKPQKEKKAKKEQKQPAAKKAPQPAPVPPVLSEDTDLFSDID